MGFSEKAATEIPGEVGETLQPLLRLIATLSDEIKTFDQRIDKLAAEKYMHTQLLRQVNGVGPVTVTGLRTDTGNTAAFCQES